MTAIDSTGSRRSVSQIAAPRDRTIFHFLSLECGACSAELPAWSDYLAQHGNEGVIFITVDESEIPKGVPGLDLPSDHIFAIARDPGKPRRTFRVPHTVVADSCGVVVRVVQRVADL